MRQAGVGQRALRQRAGKQRSCLAQEPLIALSMRSDLRQDRRRNAPVPRVVLNGVGQEGMIVHVIVAVAEPGAALLAPVLAVEPEDDGTPDKT